VLSRHFCPVVPEGVCFAINFRLRPCLIDSGLSITCPSQDNEVHLQCESQKCMGLFLFRIIVFAVLFFCSAFVASTIIMSKYRARLISQPQFLKFHLVEIKSNKNKYVSIPCLCPSFRCPSNMSHSAVSYSVTVA
jgi:hypothetical protein